MDLVDHAREYLVATSWMASRWYSNADEVQSHRRLQSGPSFVDFVVLVGLGLILYYMLQLMKRFSNNWKAMMKLRIDKALEARKAVKDPFRNTYGYSWDYCMVFDIHDAEDKLSAVQEKYSLKYIIDQLAEGGLQTKLFYSVQNDEVYLKIRAPMKRLQREADRINYRLLLEPTYLGNKLREGNLKGPMEKQWKPVEVPFDSIQTKVEPYDYIYCDYKMDEKFADLYKKYPNNSIFRGVDRLKLIANIISARRSDGGCFIDVYRLIKDKAMISFFPLHDAVELRELEERWMRMCELPWKQNVDCVKDYFGEKIAMFFLWLGHYTSWLMPAAIIGFFAWINVAADANNPNSATMPYFATFVALWSTVMLEYWKRKEKGRAMRWGTIGFEDEEQDRPQFEASEIPSPITGDKIRYFPRDQFLYRITFSVNVIGTLILIVLAIVAGIFALRIMLSKNSALNVGGLQLGSTITALINAVQIQVLNEIYNQVAVALTNYENHRTNTEYEDALIAKTFIFQFVNSFASLFYIAFVKPFIPDIDPCMGNCMAELQASLGTIFMTRLATGSILKLAIPYVMQKMKEKAETKGVDKEDLTDVELQFIQAEYHVILGTFADFASLAIQFGYATMFIAAYPLALIMSFVANYVEQRVDAWRLCQQCRRPEPRSCEDIGTWFPILEIISTAAVLTNAGLVAFTSTNCQNYTWAARVWIFFGISAGVIAAKYYLAVSIPDIPEEVEIQIQRQKYFIDKIMYNVPDDDIDHLMQKKVVENKYVVRVNDDDPL